jgi:DNA-binding NarL/FixJ family response regulator
VREGRVRCHDQRVAAARFLIVDDHAGFRAAVRTMFEAAGYDVVGEAADAAEAISRAAELHPEVVLLDVVLPDGNGFDVCERLTQPPDPPAVVLTSSRDAAEYADRLATTQARGFVLKSRLTVAAVVELAG